MYLEIMHQFFLPLMKNITLSCATSSRSGSSGLCAFYKYATSPRSGSSGLCAFYKCATLSGSAVWGVSDSLGF